MLPFLFEQSTKLPGTVWRQTASQPPRSSTPTHEEGRTLTRIVVEGNVEVPAIWVRRSNLPNIHLHFEEQSIESHNLPICFSHAVC